MKRSWIETFSESLGLIPKISDRPDWSEEFAMEGPRELYKYPDPKLLVGSNFCDIGFAYDKSASKLVVMSSSDNLIKGASGQAVQNMNVSYRMEENLGLI